MPGRAWRQQECSVGCEPGEVLVKEEESRVRSKQILGKQLWNFLQPRDENSTNSANFVPRTNKKIVIRRRQSNVLTKELWLDPNVTDNNFALYSTIEQVSRGLRTRDLESVVAKAAVHGRACTLVCSLHEERKKELKQGGNIERRGKESGVQTCRILYSPPLDWPGQLQLRNHAFGKFSNALHHAKSLVNVSYLHQDEVAPSDLLLPIVGRQGNVQQQPGGRWWRTLLSSLAAAAGLKLLSPKMRWLLPELVTLPWLKNRKCKEATQRTPLLRGRGWWRLPVNFAVAISSHLNGSLFNYLIAARLLLLVLDIRGRQQQEHSYFELTMLDEFKQRVECRSQFDNFETCCVSACEEARQSQSADLPWDWREEIVQLIALTQKEDATKHKAPSKEGSRHLAGLDHAALSNPTSFEKKSAEHLEPASLHANSLLNCEGRCHLQVEAGDMLDAREMKGNLQTMSLLHEVYGIRGYLRHSKSDGSTNCLPSYSRRALLPYGASVLSLHELGLATGQNLTGESSCSMGDSKYCTLEDTRGVADACKVSGASVQTNETPRLRADLSIPSGQEGSNISTLGSEDPLEGIEFILPLHTANNKECISEARQLARLTDRYHHKINVGSNHFESHHEAPEDSQLLKPILLGKCEPSVDTSDASMCASDGDDSDCFLEACSVTLPDLDCAEEQLLHEFDPQRPYVGKYACEESVESVESPRSYYSDGSGIHVEEQKSSRVSIADWKNDLNFDSLSEPVAGFFKTESPIQGFDKADTDINEHPGPHGMTCVELDGELIPTAPTMTPLHFADHPTCIALRKRRHGHGDQNYLSPDDLKSSPWSELVFWHGHCHQGNPTLCVLLGKAVQDLPTEKLQIISSVIISQMEYAELNFFKRSAKQMNIIMDLWGLSLMRMPPLDILSSVGMIMNRDYAGRGGFVLLVNAPVMLSLVMSAIKRVITRPAYNNGVMIEKGFLERKDQIFVLNRNYGHMLKKHFEASFLPSVLEGQCPCKSCPKNCVVGADFLSSV